MCIHIYIYIYTHTYIYIYIYIYVYRPAVRAPAALLPGRPVLPPETQQRAPTYGDTQTEQH